MKPRTMVAIAMLLGATSAVASTNASDPAKPSSGRPSAVYAVAHETTSVVIERDGKTYVVDLETKSVREQDPSTQAQSSSSTATAQQDVKETETTQQASDGDANRTYYVAGDERLFTLPTGQRLQKHGLVVGFTHRFAYSTAFTGRARGHLLDGLDDISLSSFGFKYGVTNRIAVSAFRSPTLIGRPIELGASYMISEERSGAPLNAMLRFSVEGQNDFSRNFTTNFEGIFSRSITSRAALYLTPTASIHNRPVIGASDLIAPAYQPCAQALANDLAASFQVKPCANTLALGVGLAVDIRPTVALVFEANPTLVNARELGIHHAPFSFGIQKKIFRHAFTFGWTTAPGSTVAQRSGSKSTFRHVPNSDTPAGLFIGFNLSRQLH